MTRDRLEMSPEEFKEDLKDADEELTRATERGRQETEKRRQQQEAAIERAFKVLEDPASDVWEVGQTMKTLRETTAAVPRFNTGTSVIYYALAERMAALFNYSVTRGGLPERPAKPDHNM